MEEMFFCPSCMVKAAPVDGKCPVCGRDVNIQNAQHQLPVYCILNGRYVVGKVLGAGGFGITYIGYDLKLDSRVAIKEYYPSGAANRSISLTVIPTTEVKGNPFEIGKARFLKEAKTLSEFVGDGNIVTLRDYFEENGTAYIVMEYLEGKDLSHYAKEHGRFEFGEALDLLEPVMLALNEVHKRGLIHRDISPSNIMVLNNGKVKVLDFGSARLQNTSGELSLSVMLKPGYAPMEQYSTHGEQGPWTDVYAMSATIYKLITGKTPPSSTDRLMEDTLEPPSTLGVKITPAQEEALLHGLALKPADRTQTMAELAESLRGGKKAADSKAATKSEKKPEGSSKSAAPEKKKAPKKRVFAIAAAALTVLVLALVVLIPSYSVPAMKNDAAAKTEPELNEPVPSSNAHIEELAAAREAIAGHRETTISAGSLYTLGLRTDGTVLAAGNNTYGQSDVSDWTDIAAISAGVYHTVGLKTDGTVVVTEYSGEYDKGQFDVSGWTDIVAVSAGFYHTVGLKADGTVVATGRHGDGRCDVENWTDIVAVSAGSSHTVGLRADGTVVAAGNNGSGQCDVSGWTDIVAVSAGYQHTVGLKADGTVVAAGVNYYGKCNVSYWTDIVAVGAGGVHTIGLKADGTVVIANIESQYDASGWTDIVAVSAGGSHVIGLKADGTVVTVGFENADGGDVSWWTGIKLPEGGSTQQSAATVSSHSETTISAAWEYTVGLLADGTVIAAGDNTYGQCNVSDWTDISAVSAGDYYTVGLKKDGTVVSTKFTGEYYFGQTSVSGWTDIIAVSAGGLHTVGLKADGTVVAVGNQATDRCYVGDWTDIIAVSAGGNLTLGLKSDGTVVTAGKILAVAGRNDLSQIDVSCWTDITSISAGCDHAVGLKADGTVVAVGRNDHGQCDVSDWTNIVAVSANDAVTAGLKADGTVVIANRDSQYDVSGWKNIVAVTANEYTIIGLKADGTVVAAGSNEYGQCDISGWEDIKLP